MDVNGRRRLKLAAAPQVTYAIGDVHGCLEQLVELEQAIAQDARNFSGIRLVVLMGDYVNRGPQSREVLDYLTAPPPAGLHRLALAGNHDVVFSDVVSGVLSPGELLGFGGDATYRSYGCDFSEYDAGLQLNERRLREELDALVPPLHRRFLATLPLSLETPTHFFAHAGARPGLAFAEQTPQDLLWNRLPTPAEPGSFAKPVVHGHSVVNEPFADEESIALDTGACFGGPLTAARLLPGHSVDFLSI